MSKSGIDATLGVFQSHRGDPGSYGMGAKGSRQEGCLTEAVRKCFLAMVVFEA